MANAPSFPFYPGDWLKDPALGMCSPEARGIYIDLLCAMHESESGFRVSGTSAMLARLSRCTTDQLEAAVQEFQTTSVLHVTLRNGLVTLKSRRLERESKHRENTRLRVSRHRAKREGNAGVTAGYKLPSSSSSSSKSNSRGRVDPVRRSVGSRLDWTTLPDDALSFAVERGMTERQAHETFDSFRDYWTAAPGQKGVKLDWLATWRNWVRRDLDKQRQRQLRRTPETVNGTTFTIAGETIHVPRNDGRHDTEMQRLCKRFGVATHGRSREDITSSLLEKLRVRQENQERDDER